jgi:toxin secretion/phage lysis holin
VRAIFIKGKGLIYVKTIWNGIQVGVAAFGGFLGWFMGGLDGLLYALIAFVVVDYITGVLRAAVERKLSSRIGARGIAKKVAIFLIIGVANVTDIYLLNNGSALRTAVILFYCSNEGISLLENATALGLPVPEKLKKILSQLRKKDED